MTVSFNAVMIAMSPWRRQLETESESGASPEISHFTTWRQITLKPLAFLYLELVITTISTPSVQIYPPLLLPGPAFPSRHTQITRHGGLGCNQPEATEAR